jgi:ribulose-5-phosphate 4-epimerase/fuculose-1-phosphate aldolase
MNHFAAAPVEQQLRTDLAAAFRIIAKLGMHEAVANHFSAAVSAEGRKFLMNPKWRHFSRIKASELVLFDLDDAKLRKGQDRCRSDGMGDPWPDT